MTLPLPGVPATFVRTPDTSLGLQFDGQVSTLNTIFNAAVQTVGAAGVRLVIFFGEDNLVDSVTISGGHMPATITFSRMDWVLLPQNGGLMQVIPDGALQAAWVVQS